MTHYKDLFEKLVLSWEKITHKDGGVAGPAKDASHATPTSASEEQSVAPSKCEVGVNTDGDSNRRAMKDDLGQDTGIHKGSKQVLSPGVGDVDEMVPWEERRRRGEEEWERRKMRQGWVVEIESGEVGFHVRPVKETLAQPPPAGAKDHEAAPETPAQDDESESLFVPSPCSQRSSAEQIAAVAVRDSESSQTHMHGAREQACGVGGSEQAMQSVVGNCEGLQLAQSNEKGPIQMVVDSLFMPSPSKEGLEERMLQTSGIATRSLNCGAGCQHGKGEGDGPRPNGKGETSSRALERADGGKVPKQEAGRVDVTRASEKEKDDLFQVREMLQKEREQLTRDWERLRLEEHNSAIERKRDMLEREKARSDEAEAHRDLARMQRKCDMLMLEREDFLREKAGFLQEQERMQVVKDEIQRERDGLAKDKEYLEKERDLLVVEKRVMAKEQNRLDALELHCRTREREQGHGKVMLQEECQAPGREEESLMVREQEERWVMRERLERASGGRGRSGEKDASDGAGAELASRDADANLDLQSRKEHHSVQSEIDGMLQGPAWPAKEERRSLALVGHVVEASAVLQARDEQGANAHAKSGHAQSDKENGERQYSKDVWLTDGLDSLHGASSLKKVGADRVGEYRDDAQERGQLLSSSNATKGQSTRGQGLHEAEAVAREREDASNLSEGDSTLELEEVGIGRPETSLQRQVRLKTLAMKKRSKRAFSRGRSHDGEHMLRESEAGIGSSELLDGSRRNALGQASLTGEESPLPRPSSPAAIPLEDDYHSEGQDRDKPRTGSKSRRMGQNPGESHLDVLLRLGAARAAGSEATACAEIDEEAGYVVSHNVLKMKALEAGRLKYDKGGGKRAEEGGGERIDRNTTSSNDGKISEQPMHQRFIVHDAGVKRSAEGGKDRDDTDKERKEEREKEGKKNSERERERWRREIDELDRAREQEMEREEAAQRRQGLGDGDVHRHSLARSPGRRLSPESPRLNLMSFAELDLSLSRARHGVREENLRRHNAAIDQSTAQSSTERAADGQAHSPEPLGAGRHGKDIAGTLDRDSSAFSVKPSSRLPTSVSGEEWGKRGIEGAAEQGQGDRVGLRPGGYVGWLRGGNAIHAIRD